MVVRGQPYWAAFGITVSDEMFARTVLVNGFRLSPGTGKLGHFLHITSLKTGSYPGLRGCSAPAAIAAYRYKHTAAKSACSSHDVIQRLLTQDGYAEEFVRSMGKESRARLAQELRSHHEREQAGMEDGKSSDAKEIEPLTRDQYIKLALRSGAPFIVFGFIDNSIMIVCIVFNTCRVISRQPLHFAFKLVSNTLYDCMCWLDTFRATCRQSLHFHSSLRQTL